jgi:WYL domain
MDRFTLGERGIAGRPSSHGTCNPCQNIGWSNLFVFGKRLPIKWKAPSIHVLDTICAAINAKQLLRVRYHDKVRLLEPYLLGEYSDNRPFLLAWMTRCEDDAAKVPGWQHYLVSQIGSLEILAQTFDGARTGYNPAGDGRILRILCSVPALKLV